MERVVTVNLNGNPYTLEEPAYDALRAYLAQAEAALSDNPDKAEVIRDLEQAIAEKCATALSPHKGVVTAADMAKALSEMGPVEGAPGQASQASREPPTRRLYRIREGAKVAGVCAGIGAYFDLDANVVRLLFIVATLFTSGFFILVYAALMFAIPSAHTSAEWAAAHGVPFNAQEVIDRAKREYERFADSAAGDWRRARRAQRRAWREQMRARWHGFYWGAPAGDAARQTSYISRVFAGLVALALSLVGAALLIAFLVALFSLLNTGAVVGWAPPADVPLWLAILVLCIAYGAVSGPIRYLRRSSYAVAGGYSYGYGWNGLVTMLAIAAGAYLAYNALPDFREWVQQTLHAMRGVDVGFR